MKEPLSMRELICIDKEVMKAAEEIYSNYTRRFFTDKKTNKFQGLIGRIYYALLMEAELYYNGELISSYAIFKAMRDNKVDYRVNAYYLENLLFRIVAFWEYIYQFINQYLFLNLYDQKSKGKIIKRECHIPKFISHGRGMRIEYEPKSKSEQKAIREQLKEIKLINKWNIVSSVYSIYEVKNNIEKLMQFIINNKVEKIKDIRNQIIHQRPAGASFTVNFDDALFNSYSISINNDGWIDLDEVLNDTEQCLDIIKEAIQTIHEIIYLNEFPNRIENAGKEYFIKQVSCINCKKTFALPSELLGDNDKFSSVTICPNCGRLGCKVMKKVPASEVDHDTQFGDYIRSLKKLEVGNE